MRAVLRTIVACVALLALTVIVFIFSGVYDVAAVHPDNPFAARIIRTISDHSIAAQLDKIVVPTGFDAPDRIAAGEMKNCVPLVTVSVDAGIGDSAGQVSKAS